MLGLGNVIMGDEGVGVHVARVAREESICPRESNAWTAGRAGSSCWSRWSRPTASFLIDATADENPIGTVTRTTPKFSKGLSADA